MSRHDDVMRLSADPTSEVVEAERLLVETAMAARPCTDVLRLRRCATELSVLAISISGALGPSAS